MYATAAKRRSSRRKRAWTIEAICALGATKDVDTAGAILGFGRT
jgi:hypothetical protein